MSYLNPTVQLTEEEIKERLINHPINVELKARFQNEDENPIQEKDYQQIINYLESKNKIASPSAITPDIGYTGYKWTQTDNKIIIKYIGDHLEELKVNIDGNKITSSGFISGLLYRIPQEYKVTVDSNTILIELTVNEKWPIIIIGGDNIDQDSMFIIAYSALYTNLFSICRRLLLHNAMRNHFCSLYLQSFLSLREGNKNASFFWCTQLYINCKNKYPTSFAVICELLMESEDEASAILAENILIDCTNLNGPIAFLYLGFLHMSEIQGFKSNDSLAYQYLKEAAEKYKNPKAMDTLGRMFLFSIGVNQDIKKGFDYLVKAGLPKDQIVDLLKKAEVDENQIQSLFESLMNETESNGEDDSTLSKVTIVTCSAIALSAVLFIGYKIMKRK